MSGVLQVCYGCLSLCEFLKPHLQVLRDSAILFPIISTHIAWHSAVRAAKSPRLVGDTPPPRQPSSLAGKITVTDYKMISLLQPLV